jgi:hypothetical protein
MKRQHTGGVTTWRSMVAKCDRRAALYKGGERATVGPG